MSMYEAEIENLQQKLVKTMAEHDTIKYDTCRISLLVYSIVFRDAFQALISVLKLPEDTDLLSFSLTDININFQANTNEYTKHSKEEYPGLCFWVRSDYNSFAMSAEAQSMDHGKAPWLEQLNGDRIMPDQLRAICASLRRTWAELVQRKIAPQTWTKISASAKALVYKIMVKEHPLIGLDGDGFKLEMLCVNDYSGWQKNHLGLNGKWKEPSSNKAKPKEESKLEFPDAVPPMDNKETTGGSQHVEQLADTIPTDVANTNHKELPCPLGRDQTPEDIPFGVVLPMPTNQSQSPPTLPSVLSHHSSSKENELPSRDPPYVLLMVSTVN
ncbi:hypothetical protein BKA82DRAFT_9995 [Pisolithus tinctorius]|uniref:Uncharacterized protein n=1 Tax=Pisolithus tinctorius Marx 270 TaxID=870435 RepID=A0A0C3P3A9_PISTI|nr:hypothetical protein BKA82DRAFT_9995 [Pisolithus tinctorius]KIO01779.1 hypothetical protein M404DRAFT_9995 [Pisolithus tinctorius Marx 270]